MTTTQRTSRSRNTELAALTVLVDTRDATQQAATFVYAVAAALGLSIAEFDAAPEVPVTAHIQLNGNTILAGNRQWHYPEHEATFEHWLVTQCFVKVDDATVWAVVQTSFDTYPMLAAAMAYAYALEGALLIDADAAGALSEAIQTDTDHAIDTLDFDFDMPSPHIYLLNAPRWHHVALMLQRSNPLHSVLLPQTISAARHHFAHTVIDCGADLFLAQRLAAEGVEIIHVDDASRPLYVNLTPYKQLNYFVSGIPEYGRRRDFEFIVKNTRRRRGMRRWMQRGDRP